MKKATKKKKPAAKKAAGKKGTRKKRRSLRGLGSLVSHPAVKEAANPLALVGGLILGTFISKGLNKIELLNDDPAATGFQVKSLIKPGIIILTGGASVWLGHKKKMQAAKYLGYGLIINGVNKGVKVALNKDLFFGALGAGDDQPTIFTESKEELVKFLAQNSFKPDLPDLRGFGDMNKKDGSQPFIGESGQATDIQDAVFM